MNILAQIKLLLSKSPLIIVSVQFFFVIAMLRLIDLEENKYLRLVEILGLLITLLGAGVKAYSLVFGTQIIEGIKDE